jgi:hypothetical protein
LTHHLKRIHPNTIPWIEAHSKSVNRYKECVIDSNLYKFVLWFIDSRYAITEIENPLFLNILDKDINCPSYDYFRYTILRKISLNMFYYIEQKMIDAIASCLLVDFWKSKMGVEWIAVGAKNTYSCGKSEVLVMDFLPMDTSQNAENVQLKIEAVVNCYSFDYTKINGIQNK